MPRECVYRQRLSDILVDIGKDLIYLRMVSLRFFRSGILSGIAGEAVVQVDHQLKKDSSFQKIGAVSLDGGKFVDVVEKPFLFLLREGNFVPKAFRAAGKAVIEVGPGRTE